MFLRLSKSLSTYFSLLFRSLRFSDKRYIPTSVTRLGYFGKVFARNFLTKVAKYLAPFVVTLNNMTFLRKN